MKKRGNRSFRRYRHFAPALTALLILSSCVGPGGGPHTTPIRPTPQVVLTTTGNAMSAGVMPGPAVASLGVTQDQAARALAAFRTSCPGLVRRNDPSGLTRGSDWESACATARTTDDGNAQHFFATQFSAVQVANGQSMATGYYEPQIEGCRTRTERCQVPIYGMPADLVEVDVTQPPAGMVVDTSLFPPVGSNNRLRGRLEGNRLVPYPDRSAIEQGALQGRGLEIAWAADPVELFFLQIQGSGQLHLPDGGVMRIGYAGQNGHTYVGIGKLLRDRGVLQPGEASMQGLMTYLRRQPDGGASVMRENPSWVFFRELRDTGPLGAMGYPVVRQASVAADPQFVPLGAPVFLSMDHPEASGLWVAQDTGGAIKGSNRFDTFWGAGEDARRIAGGLSARGSAYVLLPRAAAARIAADRGSN